MRSPVPGPRIAPLAVFGFAADPYTFFARCRRRYGDPFGFQFGARPLVLTGKPEHVRTFFSLEPEATRAFNPENLAPLIGQGSLLILSGERHRRERKLLTPSFHGQRMRTYGAIIRDVALRRAAAWKVGEPFSMQESTQAISLDVILRAVFGLRDEDQLARFERELLATIESLHPSLIMMRGLHRDLGPFTPWRRFSRARARADALTRAELAARRLAPAGDDILSLMLAVRDDEGRGLGDDEIVDELHTLLFAGHETTAIALAWAFYWLLRTPAALARLREELAGLGQDPDPDAVAALPYLDAVCHEVLRLWPIIPMAPRILLRPLQLGPYRIPPNTGIATAITLLHEDPDLYPSPHEFRPERFLGRKFSPFEYAPFGGGHRRCIGAAFALYEMKLVLAALAPTQQLRLLSPPDLRPRRRNLSLGPGDGVRVVRVA